MLASKPLSSLTVFLQMGNVFSYQEPVLEITKVMKRIYYQLTSSW